MLIKKNKIFIFKFFIIFQIILFFSNINNLIYATSTKEFTEINVPAAVVMDMESRKNTF